MNIEHHVTSLELSRKLKELGVPQESFYFWRTHHPKLYSRRPTAYSSSLVCSAFLASELGEMLPEDYFERERYEDVGPHYWYEELYNQTVESTEPDARAKLLIHLIEQGVVDPKKP